LRLFSAPKKRTSQKNDFFSQQSASPTFKNHHILLKINDLHAQFIAKNLRFSEPKQGF